MTNYSIIKNKLFLSFKLSAFCVLALSILGCDNDDDDLGLDQEWQLVWEDDFEGPAGQLPDASKWGYDIGTGWGNQQLEFTTDRADNASLDGEGNLALIGEKRKLCRIGLYIG